LATVAATATVTLVGIVMERFFLRRFPEQELPQALLTFGFLLIFADLSLWLWGGTPQTLPKPAMFERSIRIGAIVFPTYRLVVIGGLGSLKGAFVGGLVVGLLDNFGKALFPELALFTVFAPMAVILAVRPTGLFGAR